MANDMTLFGGSAKLPAHLANMEMDAATLALAGGTSGKRISIRGMVWRLMNAGVEVAQRDERYLNAVVVASAEHNSRTFYAGTYVEGEQKPPVCWSSDDITPDEDVKEKQSPKCATCPQNIAGSGEGESRACRYSRRLAVVLDGDLGGDVYGLQVPAQSLFGLEENNVAPLQAYSKKLLANRVPISAVVTEMKFDTTSATPKIGFKPVRYLTAEEFAIVQEQGKTQDAQDAIAMTVFAQDSGSNGAASTMGIAGTPAPAATQAAPAATQPAATQRRARPKPTAAAAENLAAGGVSPDTPVPSKDAPAPATTTAAPQAAPAAPDVDDEEAALLAQLEAKRKAKAAAAAAAAAQPVEPVVVKQAAAAPVDAPSSVEALLGEWDDE